ncbi:MAG: hypothetical protein JRJ45_08005 [Deltaproteobacteria bacterium]|nr:hypothetical protein [Deltaproteobacteria bacterium]
MAIQSLLQDNPIKRAVCIKEKKGYFTLCRIYEYTEEILGFKFYKKGTFRFTWVATPTVFWEHFKKIP